MRRVVLGAAAAALSAAVLAGVASGARSGDWYWSPGLCKSRLAQYGMRLDDGRTFNVAQAFCVGKGGPTTCMWSSNHVKRLFAAFTAFSRSYDGVVRMFTLTPTSRSDYRATSIRAIAREASAARFSSIVEPYASAAARREQTKGCAPYSP